MDEITALQAEVLKTLASARRLEILHAVAREPREVSRIASELGVSQPNVSQHLAVLRSTGLVEAERDGREVRYRLADPDVIVACSIMRGVLERRIRRLAELSARATTSPDPRPETRPVEPAATADPAATPAAHDEVTRWTNP